MVILELKIESPLTTDNALSTVAEPVEAQRDSVLP